uniref:Histone-binding protein RBBP4-A n=1 Tax=Lygus hesperus TaxID=30085 RepID=A0A0A9YZD7_LYGHE
MPQNPNIIATKSSNKDVYIFDRTKFPARPAKDAPFSPNIRLTGHRREGYGLSWCPMREGVLVSGSDDSLICLWDVSANVSKDITAAANRSVPPLHTYTNHTDVVMDVCFHPTNPYLFASCGDDKKLFVWDTRLQGKPSINFYSGHTHEINTVSFNFHNDNILATGSNDCTCGMWDLRVVDKKLHSFESHISPIYNVLWSPHSEYILASSSTDRRVNLWDIAKIGQEQNPEDAEDGPPELLFVHAGHTDKIADISWNPCVDWMLSSISDDAILQIWQPAEPIYNDDFDDIDDIDFDEDE